VDDFVGKLAIDEAYERIRQRVLSGEFLPGALLSQRKLAEDLRLGHTPVRAAMASLAREGLLKVISRRGTFVNTVTRADLREIFEARLALESAAAYFAAQYGGTDELAALSEQMTALVKRDEQAIDKEQEVGWVFHEAMFRACRNVRLGAMYADLRAQSGLALKGLAREDGAVVRRGTLEHLAVFDAIFARDADAARTLMWNHVKDGTEARMRIITRTENQ
jgi:DNA-binding GntR family transcriptional regulator